MCPLPHQTFFCAQLVILGILKPFSGVFSVGVYWAFPKSQVCWSDLWISLLSEFSVVFSLGLSVAPFAQRASERLSVVFTFQPSLPTPAEEPCIQHSFPASASFAGFTLWYSKQAEKATESKCVSSNSRMASASAPALSSFLQWWTGPRRPHELFHPPGYFWSVFHHSNREKTRVLDPPHPRCARFSSVAWVQHDRHQSQHVSKKSLMCLVLTQVAFVRGFLTAMRSNWDSSLRFPSWGGNLQVGLFLQVTAALALGERLMWLREMPLLPIGVNLFLVLDCLRYCEFITDWFRGSHEGVWDLAFLLSQHFHGRWFRVSYPSISVLSLKPDDLSQCLSHQPPLGSQLAHYWYFPCIRRTKGLMGASFESSCRMLLPNQLKGKRISAVEFCVVFQ